MSREVLKQVYRIVQRYASESKKHFKSFVRSVRDNASYKGSFQGTYRIFHEFEECKVKMQNTLSTKYI